MTSLTDTSKESFLSRLADQFDGGSADTSLQKIRDKSWDHFQELGLPSRHMEVYRYVKLRKLYEQQFSVADKSELSEDSIKKYIPKGCEDRLIVLVNGSFQPALSSTSGVSEKLVVLPLQEAVKTYGALINNSLAKSLKMETDPFVSLNGALQTGGVFIYLPPKTQGKGMLHILNFVDAGKAPVLTSPRAHLFVGAQSQAEVCLTNQSISGDAFFSNQYLDLTIEEGARLDLMQLTLGGTTASWTFDAVRATLKRDSVFKSVAITDGAGTVRHDYRVQLTGSNGEASLNGLWKLDGNKESHANVLIDHQAPHCRSTQLFKGVLDDASCSSFEGKILVRQAAQKTDAFQLNNNLLLSDKANADSKPNLEIFADDVKASHGATVGQLDAEQMFYLRARGYSPQEANQILVRAFCKEVTSLIADQSLRASVERKLMGTG